MLGCPNSVYRELGTNYPTCPGQMFGDMAPGATWQMTFLHAALGKALSFVGVPSGSVYLSLGNGQVSPSVPKKHHKGCTGGNGGPGHH
jgi:hypothetical protein